MAKPTLFEYAVVHHPTATKAEIEANVEPVSTVLIPPTIVLAGSKEEVQFIANGKVAALEDHPPFKELSFLVRAPFA